MSGPADRTPEGEGAAAAVLKRSALPKVIVVVALAVIALLVAVVAATRYGVLLPQARLLIEARTDGLRVGRVGQLRIEGLSGDILRDFRVRRLTLRDEKGVWLEANQLHLTWRYTELFRRRFDADLIEAESVRILRRPVLTPKGKDRGLPVSFHIDQARARVEMLPAFSYRRGVYDLAAQLDVERRGGQSGKVSARSVLHPGDYLNLDFAFGRRGPVRLLADADEARGGALAGALGLAADQPFHLRVRAAGTVSEGRFDAVATSGRIAPLFARGVWNPQGGQAGGRLLLTASTLTAPVARRVGPEVLFGLAGRRADDGLFALDATLRAANLQVRASGAGDLGQRRLGPRGVRIDAQTPALSRIVGGPDTGPARLTGALTGELAAWRFAGSAAVSDVALGGYGLARVSGPVEVGQAKGGLNVKARLAGAGGRGAGYLAAVLGGAPAASLDAQRLANGQLLLRRLDLTGRGLRLEATGGRSILGALNFKGRAQVTNLAAARVGASGGAGLTFSASQARAGQPWTFSLDARGERLAVGFAELDRLLGPRPRLRMQAAWNQGRLSVARANLEGAALNASAAGVMGADRRLAFKTNWSATGPVRAGPVEITGRVRGTGEVTGAVAAPRISLIADLDEVDLPRLPLRNARVNLVFQRRADGSSGAIAVVAQSAQGPAQARSDFRFPRGGVDLTDLSVDAGGVRAEGSLSLRRSAPSAADLALEVGPGAFLNAGRAAGTVRIVDAPGGARATLKLAGENLRLPGAPLAVRRARLTADGPLARLPFSLDAQGTSGEGAWKVAGRGTLSEARPGYLLAFDGRGTLGERDLRTVETATFRFGGPERAARVRLAGSQGARLDLDALLRGETADVRAQVAGLRLGLVNEDLDGQLAATLTVQGRGQRLDGVLDARLMDARGRGTPAAQGIDGAVRAQLAGDTIVVAASTQNEQGLRSNLDLTLPAEASAAPFRIAIARRRPMSGRFSAEGEVRPLWDLLIGGERSLAGYVRTSGTLGGTLADPRASGQVSVDRGRFDDGGTGLSLRDVTLRAAFAQDGVNVTEARGVDGRGGRVDGSGHVSLQRDGVSSFKLQLRGFQLIDNEVATASATGEATISRDAKGQVTLTGDLTIDEAEVAAEPVTPTGVVAMDVVEVNRPADLPTGLPARARRGQGWALDVDLSAPRRVFLRGRGLDVEFSLDAHVGGTTTRPDLTGTARVVRGDYEFAGKRFEFDDRSVIYLSTRPSAIRLQLDAVRDDPTLSVTVRIRGTAERPEITLASTPSLPNDEVLSQVLFGRSATQLSGVEAAQLAAALSTLRGGGGLDVLGNLRSFAGLDRLAFGGDEASGVTVSGGKYLTDDVYLELTGGGREGPMAQVEWRISRTLAVLSRFAGQAGNRIAIRWRRDY